MKSIGARLGHDVHISARVPAVRRVILTRLDFKLLNRVWIGHRNAPANAPFANEIVHFGSVHLEVIVVSGVAASRVAASRRGLTRISPPEARAVVHLARHARGKA